MKRKYKYYALAGGLAATASLAAFCHRSAPVPALYGPPPDVTDDPGVNIAETVYGPPPEETFDPVYNVPAPVYGPPAFDPENSFPEDVYGPPADYDEWDGEENEALPGEGYDPEENVPETVYGPPEDLGWE